MKHWSMEEARKLARLYAKGLSYKDLTTYFPGVSIHAIQAKLKRLNLTARIPRWTEEELAYAKKRRAEGANSKNIARELGRGWYSARNKISQFPRRTLSSDKTICVTDEMYEKLSDYAAARGIMKLLALNEILEGFFNAQSDE